MSEKYFLSPFLVISLNNEDKFVLKNLLKGEKVVTVNSLGDIDPENEQIRKFCFVEEGLVEFTKSAFQKLENFFKTQKTALGYIETTSSCPYHCKICPKGFNQQIRNQRDLQIEQFDSIVKQIEGQSNLALHLFGDPLYDKDIYRKIRLANKYNIHPSFSTNLVALNKLKLEEIAMLKIKDLTISFDSSDNIILSSIRGKISKETIDRSIVMIRELAKLAEQTGCIERIIIQKIQLNNNDEDTVTVKNIASESPKTQFVHKKFIRFPKVRNYSKYGTLEKLEKGKSVFLYHLIGAKTPFKCLKPWIKNELAVNSDGNYVPCCLTLNSSINLGNIENETISEVFDSEEHYLLRESVFLNSLKNNSTCLTCPINEPNLEIPNELAESQSIEKLKKYLISDWRFFP